jgi:exodeoxyribonuclease V beta subunit
VRASSEPVPFDVCGPLPAGVTVLEASAGTGKTFTIAALAARYVAEGTPLAHLLLVTFTRMATGELRERVRERLVSAEQGLARARHGIAPPPDDDILCLLADAPPEEVEQRRRRLATSLADFDAATIATTHGFCQHMLSGLGVAGDVEADVTFLEDPGDLVEEVVDDLYVRRFWAGRDEPPFDRAEAGQIGTIAVANPDAALEPAGADPRSVAAMRRRLAEAVRGEVDRRKRRRKLITYDDLLTRLASTLRDPDRGAAACARLRQRYHVALVDEFQDTDPIQWDILRLAFGEGDRTLVLIGDPKQAIYAFRGADVYAYLDAAQTAETRATLAVNWRSDQALVDAYDVLLHGVHLGHEGIAYRTVRAADAHQAPRLRDVPQTAPLRVRVVHRDDGGVERTQAGWVTVASARQHVAKDLAADVVRMLSSSGEVLSRSADGSDIGAEPVRPRHLAVLVGTNWQAALVRDALDAVGVPAVINGAGSVFGTAVAREWLALLEALERPSSAPRVRAVALTAFLGWTAEQVATADDAAWEQVHARVHGWAGLLRRRGVAALLETITSTEGLPGRVLARPDGERVLTDLRHVGQLLHAEAVAEQLGVTALTAWLRRRIGEARDETGEEERSRRLESDSEAVQVLTIHRAKGLEFPVVYCPFLWDAPTLASADPPVFHDAEAGNRRTIDVGGDWPGFQDHWEAYVTEERGEDLRLAYVALTRARHQAVLWWVSTWQSRSSALARLLLGRQDGGDVMLELHPAPDEDEIVERLAELYGERPELVRIERGTGGDGTRWSVAAAATGRLAVRTFERALDSRWRRASYTSLTAAAHEADVASEPEAVGTVDEVTLDGVGITAGAVGDDAAEEARLRDVPLPLEGMPGGTSIGTLVHRVFEEVDFASADLDGDLAAVLARQLDRSRIDAGDASAVVAGLRAAIETPLGPLLGDLRLRDVARSDRLDELGFELPLVGGDAPSASLALESVAAVLDGFVGHDDVLAGYSARLREPVLARDLRGYLTGSIDAVLRMRTERGEPRFAVVDYKTNWLGVDGEALSAWHYRPVALAEAMQRAHYPLQALLYTVALHRYLRWRLPGYTPEQNLAGVLYLFVRGMTGADVPRVGGQPCGVFAWRPPDGLIAALSDVLDRGQEAA